MLKAIFNLENLNSCARCVDHAFNEEHVLTKETIQILYDSRLCLNKIENSIQYVSHIPIDDENIALIR